MELLLSQVDVFSDDPHRGNPVAVVHDADALSDEEMAAFARWTNLSETTFLLKPSAPEADYRLRIFTPGGELPFAGHPTLGSCHAWLERGGQPAAAEAVVQECAAGQVTVRRGERLAFLAPERLRTGPLEPEVLERVRHALDLDQRHILGHQWVDNGPGWCAVLLDSAATVLGLVPDMAALQGLNLGVIGPHEPDAPCDFEVRAFVPDLGVPEDPVTGSLNASIGQWLIETGQAPSRYLAAQGTALKRAGRVYVEADDGDIWVSGATRTLVCGTATF